MGVLAWADTSNPPSQTPYMGILKIIGIYHVKVKITLENPGPLLGGPARAPGAEHTAYMTCFT